jgi:hypothetical protein
MNEGWKEKYIRKEEKEDRNITIKVRLISVMEDDLLFIR